MAERHGCYAHYSRALYRKVQRLGLVRTYKQDGPFTLLFDMLKSLVYVPVEDVYEGFKLIIRKCARNLDGTERFSPDSAENTFINYFVHVRDNHLFVN